jgi:hypothetical protein
MEFVSEKKEYAADQMNVLQYKRLYIIIHELRIVENNGEA